MGLEWSTPRPVSEHTSILIWSHMPKNAINRAKLWNLWREDKQDLKEDGFNVRKYNNVWSISYFHTVCTNTYDNVFSKATNKLEPKYLIDFKNKYNMWFERYGEVNSAEYITQPQPELDEDMWFIQDDF